MARPPGKRDLTDRDRMRIIVHLATKFYGGVLARGALKEAATTFSLSRNTVAKVWKERCTTEPPPCRGRPQSMPTMLALLSDWPASSRSPSADAKRCVRWRSRRMSRQRRSSSTSSAASFGALSLESSQNSATPTSASG